MGKNKNKLKRDRLLIVEKRANLACSKLEINNLPKELPKNKKQKTEMSDNYGIRHLLEKTMASRNDSYSFTKDFAKPLKVPKCIDISDDDELYEKEVIDLTETTTKCENNVQPTVIDISEEEPTAISEGEDVCVIGTYPKKSQIAPPCSPVNNQILNNGIRELIRCKEKIVVKNLVTFKSKNLVSKVKKKYKRMLSLEAKQQLLLSLPLQRKCEENICNIGSNVYVKHVTPLPSTGLRPIIIDGNNVAYKHSNYHFSCKRLEICINYFKEKGHNVIAFVPQFRMSSKKNDNPKLLKKLEREGYVVLTPSKEIDGRSITPYDDRFIVQTAVLKGGIIVSRDNYKDLLHENPAWADTIKYRTLAFTWVDDVLMFPEDPLGEFGPKLEEFLRFH